MYFELDWQLVGHGNPEIKNNNNLWKEPWSGDMWHYQQQKPCSPECQNQVPKERTFVPGISSSHCTNASVASFKAALLLFLVGLVHVLLEKNWLLFFYAFMSIVFAKLLETWNIWNSIFRVQSESEKCKLSEQLWKKLFHRKCLDLNLRGFSDSSGGSLSLLELQYLPI